MSDEIYVEVKIENWPTQLRIIKRESLREFVDDGCVVTPLVPVTPEVAEAIRICANYGMPLGITYAEYNAARDRAQAWLDEQAKGETNDAVK